MISDRFTGAWLLLMLAVVVGMVLLLGWAFAWSGSDRRQRDVLIGLIALYVLGLLSTPFLPVHGADWVLLDFVAVMVSLGAAFFGFLFGLPHLTAQSDDARSSARYRPSTNLETVADQLTKFMTGAAFASIAVVAAHIGKFGALVQRPGHPHRVRRRGSQRRHNRGLRVRSLPPEVRRGGGAPKR